MFLMRKAPEKASGSCSLPVAAMAAAVAADADAAAAVGVGAAAAVAGAAAVVRVLALAPGAARAPVAVRAAASARPEARSDDCRQASIISGGAIKSDPADHVLVAALSRISWSVWLISNGRQQIEKAGVRAGCRKARSAPVCFLLGLAG
jgi:hypothetical protein